MSQRNVHADGGRFGWGRLPGVVRYEFLMQVRRPALWIGFALLGALIIFANNANYAPKDANIPYSRFDVVINRADGAAVLFALGAGLLLADRLRRDRGTRVNDVLAVTGLGTATRMFGKYIGATLATLVPITVAYLASIVFLAAHYGDVSVVPTAVAGFFALVVPAVLFVGAFSIACTALLWTPLYQFLFVGYIFWSFLPPDGPIPTLNGTFLSLQLNYALSGIFLFRGFRTGDAAYYPHASPVLGLTSIGVLLLCGAVALVAASGYEAWRAWHE